MVALAVRARDAIGLFADLTPDSFDFADQDGVALSSVITSAPIVVSGISAAAPIAISNGSYEIDNSGVFVSTPGFVSNGASVRVQHTSSGLNGTSTNTTLTINGVSGVFTSTTVVAGTSKPGPTNTGYIGFGSSLGSLTPMSGTVNVNSPGVMQGFNLTGFLNITASNVTIRNFRIDRNFGGNNCIRVADSARNVVIEYGEMVNANASIVSGNGFTLRWCNLNNSRADAISCNIDVVVEDNYIWGLGANNPTAHADGLQITSGNNVAIRRNWFNLDDDATFNADQILIIKSDTGDISNVTVEDNWFTGNGAGYGVRFVAANGNQLSGCILRNNRWGRDFQYGTWTGGDINNLDIFCGNVWDDDGTLINSDGNAACPV
jgi:hypothetical protein